MLRFLRARGHDVQKSAALLEECLNWRQDFQIDEKLDAWSAEWKEGTSPRARLLKKYDFIRNCEDREGLPCLVYLMGQGDIPGLARELGAEAVLLHLLCHIELGFDVAHRTMLKTGCLTNNFVEIYDIGNDAEVPSRTGRAWSTVPLYKNWATIFDKCYPERVRVAYVIRVPTALSAFWSTVSPLFPRATVQKVRIHGCSHKAIIQDMSKTLSDSSIPTWLKDGADRLTEIMTLGGIVPVGELARLSS